MSNRPTLSHDMCAESMQRIIEDIRKDLEQERQRKLENARYIEEANKHKPPKR